MSAARRHALHAEIVVELRRFIAGTILFNHRVAEKTGLHLTDMQCINVLDLLGPVTPGRLAECVGLSTGGVTVMLDRLEKAGFIAREPNPHDRRSVVVRVNARKRRRIDTHYEGINKRLGHLMNETSVDELASVLAFLSRANAIRSSEPL